MPEQTESFPVLTNLPNSQVAALAEIAAVSGSTFDEVLSVAVGFALSNAPHVYGCREVCNG